MRANRKLPTSGLFTGKDGIASALRLSEDVFTGKLNDNSVFSYTELTTKVHQHNHKENYGDGVNEYNLNSYGHRGPEPSAQTELLLAGCSQTFGLGVVQEKIWTEELASRLGLSHATYAAPGWSVQDITSAIMRHVDIYGKPKMVVALLPDFKRSVMPLRFDVNSFINRGGHMAREGTIVTTLNYANDPPKDANGPRHRYIKKPYDLYEVTPFELPFYLSAQSLATLISFCKAADIQLIWSSWNQGVLNLYKALSLEGYNELDVSGFMYRDTQERHQFVESHSDCHLDLKNKYPQNFHEAFGNPHHMTLHEHVHLAEAFEEFIKSKK